MRLGFVVPIAVSLLLPSFTGAQQPQTFSETAHVELVLVDVLVTDRDGTPVLDLKREDFTLYVDGSPQELDQFSAPFATRQTGQDVSGTTRREPGRPTQLTGPQGSSDHLLVIYLEDHNLLPMGRHRALTQLTEVLDQRSNSRTQVMVAAYSGTVDIVLPPTRSRRRVSKVLAEKMFYGSQALLNDRETEEILRTLKLALENDVEELLLLFIPPDRIMDMACPNTLNYLARVHAQQVYGWVESSALALQEFARSLSIFPGQKTLIHVSDGFPLVAGQEAVEYLVSLCDGSALNQGIESRSILACCPPARYFSSAALMELQGFNTVRLWDRVAADANRNRVTIYSLQASGLQAPRAGTVSSVRTTGSTEFAARMNDQDPLFMMADETGGRAILNTNDFQPDLNQMLADQGLRYELAFQPDRPADGKVHRIRLEINRSGARPSYRRSYVAETVSDKVTSRVLGTLFHGQEDDQHGIRVKAEVRAETSKKASEVDVEIRVPLRKLLLLPEGDSLRGLVTVMLTASDERGWTLPVGSQTIPFLVEVGDEDENFEYVVRVPLERGHDWQFAVGLRDDLANTASYVTAGLSVP